MRVLVLVALSTAWAVAFLGVQWTALPWLAVVGVATAWAQGSGWRHAIVLRDGVAVGGAVLATVLEPACLPLALLLAVVAVAQPSVAPVGLVALALAVLHLGVRDPLPVGGLLATWAATGVVLGLLATEAWFHRRHPRPAWRTTGWWGVGSCVVVLLLATLAVPWAVRPDEAMPIQVNEPALRPTPVATPARGLAAASSLGLDRDLRRETALVARVEPTGDLPPGTFYLRVQALPEADLVDDQFRWRAGTVTLQPWSGLAPAGIPAVIERWGGGDAVWYPAGSPWADLAGVQTDGEGGLYRPGLGRGPVRYGVVAGTDAGLPADEDRVAAARRYPAVLARLPWERIDNRAWGALPPRLAAAAIAERLAQHCTYALTDLPDPAPGPAGRLARFLLDPEPTARRGHCQYFATAATLLLRRAGHSARVVVGFASEEREGRTVIVRHLHAHAWIEVAEDGRWWTVDPTPAQPRHLAAVAPPRPTGPPPPEPVRDLHRQVVSPPVVRSLTADSPASPAPDIGWGAALVALLLGVVALVRWWFLQRPTLQERRRRAHAEPLVALARELGLPVRRRTTLSELVAGLERLSGMDLQPYLRDHLAYLYGTGAVPRPWPVEDLRRACGTRRA